MTSASPRPSARPRYAQPQRALAENWQPANSYERALVDLLLAPSLRHYADVLLTRDGAAAERSPAGKSWWPEELRGWFVLWPGLLLGRGAHQALAVAWWTRLDTAQRRALRDYLSLDPSEYDPSVGPDVAAVEEQPARPEAARPPSTPAPAIRNTTRMKEPAKREPAAAGLW